MTTRAMSLRGACRMSGRNLCPSYVCADDDLMRHMVLVSIVEDSYATHMPDG